MEIIELKGHQIALDVDVSDGFGAGDCERWYTAPV